ncbi:hypothetical protein ACFIOY_15105 [Bradyrhizobium sp. TZ2]
MAIRQSLRHALVAAADGRLDQFTGSGPVLKLGLAESFSSIRAFIGPGAGDDPICRGGRHNRSNRWLESDRKEAPVFHRDVKGGIAVPELLPSRRAAAEA